jgi:hypothetical protein
MGNHYHLLIETPRANLDRIMRHINGVYTQRYNRLKRTDGSLFRGRYKAILVDKDAYLLQLSRYIHRNPAEVRGADDNIMNRYIWSSYLAYTNKAKPPAWLERSKTYQMLGQKQKYLGYKNFVEEGVDEDIKRFYNKGNIATVLGDREFKNQLLENEEEIQVSGELAQALSSREKPELIIKAVAKACGAKESYLLTKQVGRQKANEPRKLAMFCCQQFGDMSLKSIAALFGLRHEGSVSPAVDSVKKGLLEGEFGRRVKAIKKTLNIIK